MKERVVWKGVKGKLQEKLKRPFKNNQLPFVERIVRNRIEIEETQNIGTIELQKIVISE